MISSATAFGQLEQFRLIISRAPFPVNLYTERLATIPIGLRSRAAHEVVEAFRMDEDDNFILDRYGDKIPVYVVLWVSLSSDTGAFFIVHDSDGNGGGVGQHVIGGNPRCVIVPFHNHKITGRDVR